MGLPRTLGHEFAGVVMRAGPKAKWAVGDRVVNLHRDVCNSCDRCKEGRSPQCMKSSGMFGVIIDGGYSSLVRAKSEALVRLPDEIPYTHGCFLYCTAAVAYRGLTFHGGIRPGQRVLVTGASGGVGIHAIQIVKAMGCDCVATTSNEKKVDILKKYGADEVVVCKSGTPFHRMLSEGVDLALDLVGTPTINSSLRSLKQGGRLVVIGNVTLSRFETNPGLMILKELSIHGSNGATAEELKAVFRLVVRGEVKPVVHDILPLSDVHRAHDAVRSKDVLGRIVVVPPLVSTTLTRSML